MDGLFRTIKEQPAIATAPGTVERLPLPGDSWVTGIATFAEARQVQRSLSGQWVTACGLGVDGYYVAAPSSGLTFKKEVTPYDYSTTGTTDE